MLLQTNGWIKAPPGGKTGETKFVQYPESICTAPHKGAIVHTVSTHHTRCLHPSAHVEAASCGWRMQSVCYRRPPPPLQPLCVCHDVLSASSLRPSIHHTNLVTMVMQEAHIAKVVAMARVIEAEKTLQTQGVVESAPK